MLRPTITPTRELQNLDGLWRFAVDFENTGIRDGWQARPLGGLLEIAVPSSFNDLYADSRIRDHVGWVWYQRTVRVPRGWTEDQVFVRLDAATHSGRVYIDDALVAEHDGGYTPFAVEITDAVSPGQEFRLTIAVSNELTNATIPPGSIEIAEDGSRRQRYLHDFYNYAGLARSVWLYSAPFTHLDDITVVTAVEGTNIEGMDIDGMNVDGTSRGEGATGVIGYTTEYSGTPARISATAYDRDGTSVATAEGASGSLSIRDAKLWQPGAAYLYDLEIEAYAEGGELLDSYTLPVGIRTVEVRGNRFLINGSPFYFTGFGKHEDSAVRGKGHDNAYLVHDFQLMEWIGANSFRTAHYPYAEEVMEFADRHGIVVIDETAAVGLNLAMGGGMFGGVKRATFSPGNVDDTTQATHAQAIRELIARDKNHPSVVLWSIANEPGSSEAGAREYFEPLVALTRELDPTRPVSFANMMFAQFKEDLISDLFDVLCLNRYYGWYADNGSLGDAEVHLERELRGWEEKYGKPMIMTEYGADAQAGLHSIFDVPWTEEYQARLLDMYHRVFDRVESMVGEQVWNFADFQTSVGVMRVDGNKKGVFTRDRRPKASAHALRARWTNLDTNTRNTNTSDK